MQNVLDQEERLSESTRWKAKIVEKPGTPLQQLFIKSFEMIDGCYRGPDCLCEGKGNKCLVKGVVYRATCDACKEKGVKSV